jgi:hypothetical protein
MCRLGIGKGRIAICPFCLLFSFVFFV